MFNKITEHEVAGIRAYIDNFAVGHFGERHTKEIAPLEDILIPWQENKKTLYKMLDDKLIFSKHICYEKSRNEIISDLSNKYYEPQSVLARFVTNFQKIVEANYRGIHNYWRLMDICNIYEHLATNKYEGETIEINIPNATKTLKIEDGGKVMKFIQKFAKAWNIPDIDEFVKIHSLVLNDKKLSGTLNLSIHPLDYLTMSDNANDWSSCMSWLEGGCYRQGTVEMLNSPCVVVAYLASESTHFSFPLNDKERFDWNSKKWRQLFIITPEIITGVLGYPYHHEGLEMESLQILKELVTANLGWRYEDNITKIKTYSIFNSQCKMGLEFIPQTCYMYNDLSKGNNVPVFIGANVENDSKIKVNYSGPSECMICGEVNNIDSEREVTCSECATYHRCEECGDYIDSNNYSIIDGHCYCSYCIENFDECSICEDGIAPHETVYHYKITRNIYCDIYRNICEHCYNNFNKNISKYLKEPKVEYDRSSLKIISYNNLTKEGKDFFNI